MERIRKFVSRKIDLERVIIWVFVAFYYSLLTTFFLIFSYGVLHGADMITALDLVINVRFISSWIDIAALCSISFVIAIVYLTVPVTIEFVSKTMFLLEREK